MKRKTIALIILTAVLTLALLSACGSQSVQTNQMNEQQQGGYLAVFALFDTEGQPSFTEFLAQEDSLARLMTANAALHQAEGFTYYEAISQPLTYIGTYQGDSKFVPGNSGDDAASSLINQRTSEGTIATPLYSAQFSAEAVKQLGLADRLTAGRCFSDQDHRYQAGQQLPVLLGCEYQDVYQLGDTWQCEYLNKLFTCEVVGFLAPHTTNSFASQQGDLDRSIILPALSVEATALDPADSSFWKMLYDQKNSGYFAYQTAADYEQIKALVTAIGAQTAIPYSVPELTPAP